MASSPMAVGEPFTECETRHNLDQLQRQGLVDFGSILDADEVEVLGTDLQRKWDDPRMHESEDDQIRRTSLMRMFEYSTAFRDLILREPFASFAEVALGEDCHCMSQNALVTVPDSEALADGPGGWHVDDPVYFPLPPDVARHHTAVLPPCFVLQIFTPMTDVEELRHGPTQVVLASHHSGRRPQVQDHSVFESNAPHSFLARKTHPYAFNNQIWHRGASNVSDRTRLMGGVTYSKQFIAQKFYPFIDHSMPSYVWDGASPRLQRMLGR